MLHNPEDYPDPERFNPERFIKDRKINSEVRNPATLAFGFGRRWVVHEYSLHTWEILIIIAIAVESAPDVTSVTDRSSWWSLQSYTHSTYNPFLVKTEEHTTLPPSWRRVWFRKHISKLFLSSTCIHGVPIKSQCSQLYRVQAHATIEGCRELDTTIFLYWGIVRGWRTFISYTISRINRCPWA